MQNSELRCPDKSGNLGVLALKKVSPYGIGSASRNRYIPILYSPKLQHPSNTPAAQK